MVGFIDVIYKSFDSYKKHPLESILFSLVYGLVSVLSIIPVLGAFIGAYLIPRVLNWYYNKVFGNISTDYKLSFRVWLFYLLLVNLIALQFIILFIWLFTNIPYISVYMAMGIVEEVDLTNYLAWGYDVLNAIFLFIILIPIFIAQYVILQIFLTYSLYAVVLGKVNEFKVDVGKSLIVFLYSFGWGFIFGIVGYAMEELIPFYGYYLSLLFSIFFVTPIIQLVIAHKVLSY